MLVKTRGIVLRAKKYSESSLIVDVYTEALGRRSYIISGVRKKNARVSASLLQVMSIIDLVVYHREDKTLTRMKEVRSEIIYQELPFNTLKQAVGLFMIEIAGKTIRETEENPRLFQFLYDSFLYLDRTHKPVANLHLHFMLHLTTHLGFLPGGEATPETPVFDLAEGNFVADSASHKYDVAPGLSEHMSQLLLLSRTEAHQVDMTRSERRQLLRRLLDFYRLHIDQFPDINTHTILESVLSGE